MVRRQVSLLALVPLVMAGCVARTAGAAAAASPIGTWGEPGAPGRPSLELAEDGRLSGSDGCNRLMGTWRATGATVRFSPLASTMMYCRDVDTWLLRAAGAVMDGHTLAVQDHSGATIGTLQRAED